VPGSRSPAGRLAGLSEILGQAGSQTPGTVVISAIGGAAEVGRFPGGRLHMNLASMSTSDCPLGPRKAAMLTSCSEPTSRSSTPCSPRSGTWALLAPSTLTPAATTSPASSHARDRPSRPGRTGGPGDIRRVPCGTHGHLTAAPARPAPGTGGAVNRSLRPRSVRHMSVTTATRRPAAAHDATRRHNEQTARRPRSSQARGRFSWLWHVLGSNQRRLSRRFYSSFIPVHRNAF
jgi:hypothetical protein